MKKHGITMVNVQKNVVLPWGMFKNIYITTMEHIKNIVTQWAMLKKIWHFNGTCPQKHGISMSCP